MEVGQEVTLENALNTQGPGIKLENLYSFLQSGSILISLCHIYDHVCVCVCFAFMYVSIS